MLHVTMSPNPLFNTALYDNVTLIFKVFNGIWHENLAFLNVFLDCLPVT